MSDEEILLNVAYAKMGITTIELLKSCISLPGVDKLTGDNVLAGDVASLLYSIRINSYGSLYDPTIKCPDCNADNQLSINLSAFPVNTLDLEPIVDGTNLFNYVLKSSSSALNSNRKQKQQQQQQQQQAISIDFGFLTFNEAESLTKMLKAGEDIVHEFAPMTEHEGDESVLLSAVKGNTYITTMLDKLVKSVNGETSRDKIKRFIRSLRIGDSMQFRNFVKSFEPMIHANFDFKCKDCEYEVNIPMPINHELFGIKPEDKVAVLLEPHFVLTYYSGFSFEEYRNYPVAYKKHFTERMNEEISKAHKAQSDIPNKAPHSNPADVRQMLGKTNPETMSAKMQRFT